MRIFISYQNNSTENVKELVKELEARQHKCFFALRDIGTGVYAKAITENIETCEVFIVLLTEDSYVSPGVRAEIELVMDKLTRHIPTLVIPVKLTSLDLPAEYKYYLKPHNWVMGVDKNFSDVIFDIIEKLEASDLARNSSFIPQINSIVTLPQENKNINTYLSYMSNDPDEDYRLDMENTAIYPIEKLSYDKIFIGQKDLNVLDCHALHPRSALKRLNREETNKYIGLCYDKVTVDNANKSFGNDFVKFYQLAVLDDNFEDKIAEIMAENGIEKFDVINITMGMMDSKKPYKFLKNVVSLLKPGGYVYIRDIDDIVSYGYPDADGLIKSFIEMLRDDKFAGNRDSARTIYENLVRCHANYVSLEQSGINTSTMSFENKKKLFISYFTFAKREFSLLLKKEPQNKKYEEYLEFIDDKLDDIERSFESSEFIFNSGFYIYIAKF